MIPFTSKIFSFFLISLLILNGCVAVKQLNHNELQGISSLTVARNPTPNLKVITFTRAVLGATVGFVLLGPAGAGVAQAGARAAGKDDNQIKINDFGELVMLNLTGRLKTEIRNWPAMDIVRYPLQDISSIKKPSLVLTVDRFDLVYLGAFRGNGLVCNTHAILKDINGNTQWENNYSYSSAEFNRGKEMEEFTNVNGKLLNEEIEFAVKQTVSKLISHLQRSN